jgi:hypothetical protein
MAVSRESGEPGLSQGNTPWPSAAEAELKAMEAALAGRRDLERYHVVSDKGSVRDNRRMLLALELYTKTEDIHGVAADSLVDGINDKSIDVLYVDRDRHLAILIQGFEGRSVKETLPTGKSKDLFQAVGWALAEGSEPPPPQIQSAVEDLHDALETQAINTFEVWFVHNRPEDSRLNEEIEKVRAMTAGLAAKWLRSDGAAIEVVARQVGRHTLASWYNESRIPIRVDDTFTVEIDGYYLETGDGWRCLSTSVSGSWLAALYWEHDKRLFSANVRDYLGAKSPINQGIQDTARVSPDQLYVRNLGITALVNGFDVKDDGSRTSSLILRGISIINGAQTVGSIKDLGKDVRGRLPIRFITCSDPRLVTELIRSNNLQNNTEPMDFHSNDEVQRRLAVEFREQYGIVYDGARRGVELGSTSGRLETLSAESAGRVLAAFHLGPAIAHHEPHSVWTTDSLYQQVFPDRCSAPHILFCHSLFEAVTNFRRELDTEGEDGAMRRLLSRPGATWLVMTMFSRMLETIVGTVAADRGRFGIQFDPVKVGTREEAVVSWLDVVRPLIWQVEEPMLGVYKVRGGLKDPALVTTAAKACRANLRSSRASRGGVKEPCEDFASLLVPAAS